MRIAYLITRADDIGGAQVHVRDLATALRAEGHEAFVLAGSPGRLSDQLAERGVPFIEVPSLRRPIRPHRDLRALPELVSHLQDIAPDLLSAHSSKAGILGRTAARRAGVPSVFTAHGWAFAPGVPQPARALYRTVEGAMARFAERIIVVSEEDRLEALRGGTIAEERMTLVRNGMPDIDRELRGDPSAAPCRMLMTARFCEQKDHRTLLEALAQLRDLPFSLDLIGDGPGQPEAEALVQRLGLADRVRFLGYQADVTSRLADAQLYLLISHWEGLPRSIVEALRAGLPIVASDVGGTRELVCDGQNGCLVPAGDVAGLAARLRPLLESATMRSEMGRASRKRYDEGFTFERMYRETQSVYRQVLGEAD